MTVITRVTQNMLTQRSLNAVEGSMSRLSAAQEQETTGRRINRPSDDPAGTSVAMQARTGIAQQQQYQRNASDGLGWLSITDTTLQSMTSEVQRASTLAIQGANTGSNGTTSQKALATEVDQIKSDLLSAANTQYLGRPIFGGTTGGGTAYTENPDTGIVTYVGDGGSVNRQVGVATSVSVNTDGSTVFGTVSTDGTTAGDSVFDHLSALSTALTNDDSDGIAKQITNLQADLDRMSAAAADEGARYNEISTASANASSAVLSLQTTQSNVEDVDIAESTINVETQQTAYQAALAATSKTIQQSLLDFLT